MSEDLCLYNDEFTKYNAFNHGMCDDCVSISECHKLPVNVVNEDGSSLDDFPVNPLKEKWDKLYPPSVKLEYSQVCDGYSCMWCGRCPDGSNWKVPEEDREVWDEYQRQIMEYHKKHNPNLVQKIEYALTQMINN